jgi:large subunit ribosomal protein L19
MNRVVETVGDSYRKAEIPEFDIGDTVDVHVRIKEGERERIQIFSGTVIARRGRGVNASFTVRHLFQGEGVERVFPLHCPSVEKVEVKRKGKAKRAKLYYRRGRTGRATRLAEKRGGAVGGEVNGKALPAGAEDANDSDAEASADSGEQS